MKYWHYTIYPIFKEIAECGEILPATKGIDSNEVPGVWLSSNPNWEETVRKSIRDKITGVVTKPLSRDELFQEGFPPVRIEINPGLVTLKRWKNHKKKSGISKKFSKGLEKVAKEWRANPAEWFVSYTPIQMESWKTVEIWTGENWQKI